MSALLQVTDGVRGRAISGMGQRTVSIIIARCGKPRQGPKQGVLNILPERIALARREGLDYADFLQIVLADEVSRRDHGRLELRLRQAGFEQLCRLEVVADKAYDSHRNR